MDRSVRSAGVPGLLDRVRILFVHLAGTTQADKIDLRSRRFDVHPLDLVVTNINDASSCVGSFLSQTLAVGQGEYDILAGDVFMRNVYTLLVPFPFGSFCQSRTDRDRV